MGTYQANVSWQRQPSERFVDGRYSRAHEWAFDGGATVRASASPHVVRVPFSDPAAVDPEEALVAALSSCHMLFFLGLAASEGFTLASYRDNAIGTMARDVDGRERMAKVTLRPQVVFEGDKRPTADEVADLHHRSHDACYIANSVKSEVVIEGQAEGLR
jgi:organic hydroperoxide reductase OsmC/OhrA